MSPLPATTVALGPDAIVDASLVSAVAELWGEAYRSSEVDGQRHDPLYADTEPQRQERQRQVRDELDRRSAVLARVCAGRELLGFFWGLSLADLQRLKPAKAADVAPHVTCPPHQVAYLSMLATRPDSKGKGLGKALTIALSAAFAEHGFREVIARTINPLALEKIYLPLGFELRASFADSGSGNARRFIFGSQLPLATLKAT